jgi:hypothetical protein
MDDLFLSLPQALPDHWSRPQRKPSDTLRTLDEPLQMKQRPYQIHAGLRLDGRDCGGLNVSRSHQIHLGNSQSLLPS